MKKLLHKRERGQALVEFALVLPVLLVLLCGIIDFGWLYYNQITLNNAAREGARYAAVHYDPARDWQEEAQARMISGMAGVNGAAASVSASSGEQVTVSVTADAKLLTGITSALLGKQTVRLHAGCTMRIEN